MAPSIAVMRMKTITPNYICCGNDGSPQGGVDIVETLPLTEISSASEPHQMRGVYQESHTNRENYCFVRSDNNLKHVGLLGSRIKTSAAGSDRCDDAKSRE
jgi:hypothetical protein